MGATYSQFFPPSPSLTEANLSSQKAKVFIITGGYSGVGHHLASILYHAGGTVYIAGRSESKTVESIAAIKSARPISPSDGQLKFLALDLADLSTIKPAVEIFQSQESKLDVLFNNAGVSLPPVGSVSKQGHELQLATNCLGPYLLTQLLLPSLRSAARSSPPASVRVVWTSSQIVDLTAPKGGFGTTDLSPVPSDQQRNYTISKLGNWYLSAELEHQVRTSGILSVVQNPGNLKTNLLRNAPWVMRIASWPLLYEAKMGAYTELWAGLSGQVTLDMEGAYVVPWGRMHPVPRADLLEGLKSSEDGGTGQAAEFGEWCRKHTDDYR